MSEIHGAVGSYVVNALDPSELDEFEAHLAVCPTCSREVVEFCETAAELSLLAQPTMPPPSLRSSVLSAIKDVRPLPPLPLAPVAADLQVDAPAETSTRPRRALVEVARDNSPTPQPQPQPVDELALRRARRRTRVLALAVAAAMVVALGFGGWVVNLTQARQQQVAEAGRETQLYTAPDVKIYSKTMTNGGKVSFVVSKSLNQALFVGNDVPTAGVDQTYEMWTIANKAATADNLVAGGTFKQWFKGPVDQAEQLAVTIEQAGGATQPNLNALQAATGI